MIGGRSALLSAAGGGNPYGNWTGNYSDVSLLLRNATPLLIPLDESPTPKTITSFGNAFNTTTVVKYGTSAMVFNGSGDYFETPATTAFDFANNPFTIEAWINVSVLTSFAGVITVMNNLSGNGLHGYVLIVDSDGSLRFVDYVDGNPAFSLSSAAGVITTGQWYHVAICKEGTSTNQVRLFRNGAIVASGTRNANIPVATAGQPARIGAWRYPTALRYFNGYIDDLRITKGFARYTSDFSSSLPAELPANATDDPHYSNVSLLLRNETPSEILIPLDESPTPKTITRVGDAFNTTAVVKYGTSAMAFDGSGDCFVCHASSFVSTNTETFTLEFWAYWGSTDTSQRCLISNYTSSDFGFAIQQIPGTYKIGVNLSGDGFDIASTDSFLLNAWNHIALCGTPGSPGLSLFLNGVQQGSAYTGAVNLGSTTAGIYIGKLGVLNSLYFNGYIDDLRITKSVARYTKNFLPPPAELPAI